MAKRYYYTAPLAAAWMARDGMRFQAVYHQEKPEDDLADLELRAYEAEFYFCGDDFGPAEDKFYIHPDSEHLLKPRVGDVIQFYWPEPTDKQVVMVVEDNDSAAVYEQALDCRIIQRDGKPFFWPEVEEV